MIGGAAARRSLATCDLLTAGESGAPCLRPGGLELTDRALDLARLDKGARVLDVGCGGGITVAHINDRRGLRAVGLDASPTQLERARASRPDLEFVEGRAEDPPFADGAFDAVLAECVLSTLPDPASGLAGMTRVIPAGGLALLTDLYDRGAGSTLPRSTLPSLGRRETVEVLLAGASLEVEAWEDHTGALARLLWDLAGTGAGVECPAAAAAPRSGRRLGYFVCVARKRAARDATTKGARGA